MAIHWRYCRHNTSNHTQIMPMIPPKTMSMISKICLRCRPSVASRQSEDGEGFDDVMFHIGGVFDGSLFRQRMVSSI